MGHGIVRLQVIDYWIICAALTGAIVWNLITWRAGASSSSMRSSGAGGCRIREGGAGALVWVDLEDTVFIVVPPS